jgi:two-component system, OmpR family, phosphate regulon sensor histidine kinase PhoR
MRITSSRKLSIIIGLIVALLTAVGATTGFLLIKISDQYFIVVLLSFIVFITSFFIVSLLVNNFMFRNIKPLYKILENDLSLAINSINNGKRKDIVRDLQNNVPDWALGKVKEIDQLRQLEKYRREFLGNVSHELKTPIFNIQGYILTLLDGGLKDKSINKKYLKKAAKSVNRMISIVNDLESIARLESGELKLNITHFSIVRLIEDVFEEQDSFAKENKIRLRFKRYQEKAMFVEADKERIFEVVNNLITNSIKYGKKDGETTVDVIDLKNHIVVEISDNGIGISEKDLPRIFERFYRTDNGRLHEMRGSGLGLSIVKHILEAHNQTISVQSKLKEGTNFSITLKKPDQFGY